MNLKSQHILLLFLFPALVILQACAISVDDSASLQRIESIGKSPNDRRDYRALNLENGLKVILISDPETDKAAASMDINAGSNSDPAEFEGLAHFLEHMLFLGTQKFPQSGEYQEFISGNGGSHNAYTSYENTNYYFDIEKDSLAPALDRFSQFFIAPLFTQEYVDRERNAVHSEYQSNLQNDGRRSYSIFKKVMNQDHPLSQFSVGSLDTLQDKAAGTLRQALLDQYARYYSANQMSLAIIGQESLDQLETLALQYFSAIENRNVDAPRTNEPIFREGQLPALLEIEPIRDARSLTLTFPIPVVWQQYRAKPLNYLGNILGHEGEGSLLSLLKSKGWANGLSAGNGMSYMDNATFSVTVALTEDGVDHVDEITALVFEFITLAEREGIHQWLFDEQRVMADISFTFQEPGAPVGTVSGLSRRLQLYPAEEIITAAYAYEDYNPALYREILSYLRPDNVLLTFTSQSVAGDQEEVLFGGRYRYTPIAEERISTWQTSDIDPALAITEPNPFLPDDLSIVDIAGTPTLRGPENKPELIVDDNGVRLWFQHDNEFQVPRANFYVYAMTPLFNESLENSLLSSLVISLVNDKLNEYSYPANLAGVFYGVSSRARGFSIRLGGYNDKQQVLLEELLKTLVAADFEEERFEIIKTERIRGWENADIQMPYTRLFQKAQALLVNPYWSEQQRIDAIQQISLEDVIAFIPRMLENLNLQALYHGNVEESDALALLELVQQYLSVTPEVVDPPYGTVLKLIPGQRVVQEVSVDHDDSAIVIYLQGPDDTLMTRATISLLGTILRTPFFETLRTEQQLGYVVNAGSMPILKTNGLAMTIESPVADPLMLETEINAFLADYETVLAAMPESMFADIKAGMLNNMRQEPQSLGGLSGRFWSDILIEEYEEDSTLKMADAIEAVEKSDILAYYRSQVIGTGPGSTSAKIVARAAGRPHRDDFNSNKTDSDSASIIIEDTIESYNAFKAQSEVFRFRE
ncbi:MAG: insulysin [Pseudohongiellaceae bacterium]|jgi:insulysin